LALGHIRVAEIAGEQRVAAGQDPAILDAGDEFADMG
jgi:hypothetical protein